MSLRLCHRLRLKWRGWALLQTLTVAVLISASPYALGSCFGLLDFRSLYSLTWVTTVLIWLLCWVRTSLTT